jgi:streptomycin 6-kinase
VAEVVQPTFRSTVTRLVGEDARAWLAELPALETALAERWRLELGPELRGGLLASVRAVRREDGSDAVLKLAGPWDRTSDEAVCLRAWGGGPAPRLLEADEERGALLLERIVPGVAATDASAEHVAVLLPQLQRSDGPPLRPLADVARRRLDHAEREGRAAGAKLTWARTAVERLGEDAPAPGLVHGDFDERNLLRCDRRGICAIDPLPCWGDGTYDAAYWVHANRRRGRRARFDAIAGALDLDRGRLRDWCAVIAVHG